MQDMENFYRKFCNVTFDDQGVLSSFEPIVPNNFNFAYDVVDTIAALDPQRRAMIWCNDEGEERVFTFEDMCRYSNQAANLLKAQGVKKGDMVLLVLKRHYQFWFAILALHKLGAVGIPATHLLTKADYDYRLNAAGVSHIIATAEDDVPATIEGALEDYSAVQSKFIVRGNREGWLSFDSLLEEQSAEFQRVSTNSEDTLLLYFTSGTTGYPKMVTHDHSYPIAHIITAKFWHSIKADGLHLTVSETGWAKSVWGKLYGQWFAGAAVFVYDFDRFSAESLMEKIETYKVTSFCAPPTIYRFMLKAGMENYDFSSVEYATTAGEALNADVFKQFHKKTGLKLMEGFGQTEVTLLTCNLVGTQPKAGSLGRTTPLYDVQLVDADNNPVPPGEVGEIAVKLPKDRKQIGIFQGYYQDEEQTNTVRNNGYYYTGDTAWQDEDGYFWYVGRTDDIIKASGYRIGPFEIESVLMEHDAVFECAVTGAPDDIRGTVVKATVILSNGCTPSEALVKELQDYVKEQTAPYKYPRIIEFVEELPKTISGKIRRAEIRAAN